MSSHEADPFVAVIKEIVALNHRKRADYTDGVDPWQNFRDSGRQLNLAPGFAVELQIGSKQSRIRQLLRPGRVAQNESLRDSLIDRCVYSTIALAMYDEGLYQ